MITARDVATARAATYRRNLVTFTAALESERLAVLAIGPDGVTPDPWYLAVRTAWRDGTAAGAEYTRAALAKGLLDALDEQELGKVTRRRALALYEQSRDTVLELATVGDADFVDDLYSEWLGTRVGSIADAEAVAAVAWGQAAEAANSIGLFKQWRTQGDRLVRDSHVAAGRADPIPIDQPYLVGGQLLRFPADPSGAPGEVYNCRCFETYVKPRQ